MKGLDTKQVQEKWESDPKYRDPKNQSISQSWDWDRILAAGWFGHRTDHPAETVIAHSYHRKKTRWHFSDYSS